MDWFITNHSNFNIVNPRNSYYTNISPILDDTGKLGIFIDGYIIPRYYLSLKYKNLSQNQLIGVLYQKHKFNFIDHIKGSFIIILFEGDNFYIFNDRHSQKKFFIYTSDDEFIISNSLKLISDNVELTLSKVNAVLYCLLEHFVDGMTLFKEVFYSKPATYLTFSDNLKILNYWSPDNLINLSNNDYSFDYLSTRWKEIIEDYVEYLNPRNVTMTLTGGNDSRMVLTGLLANGIKPNAFTFGNPESSDGIIAKQIVKKLGLNYNNYFVSNPTSDWFRRYGNKIIEKGNSLINIHRAHRVDAMEQEMENNPDNEMILGGFMGGDYIKGIIYDDYITSKLVRLWKYSKESDIEKIKELVNQAKIILNEDELQEIKDKIGSLPYFNKDCYSHLIREFLYIYNVIGCTHDWQDSTIFGSLINYVVNPYMDIDFLELLFSSKYSMLNKNNPEDSFVKKINYPELQVKISHLLAPEISDIIYAKKGFYSNEEFLGNKIIYFLKRAYRLNQKNKYPQNFPYKNWMELFIKHELDNINYNLSSVFNIAQIKEQLGSKIFNTTEASWHLYTNPVNLNLNYNYFIEKSI